MEHHNVTAKRRKLTHASRVLARPFVTPLKARTPNNQSQDLRHDETATTASHVHECDAGHDGAPRSSMSSRDGAHAEALPSSVSSREGRSGFRRQQVTKPLVDDPDLARQIRLLEKQIRAVKSDIDTLERAAIIRMSRNDERLEQLSIKWRCAAQAAADELFPAVQERLVGMGGMNAWRKSQKDKALFFEQELQSAQGEVAAASSDRERAVTTGHAGPHYLEADLVATSSSSQPFVPDAHGDEEDEEEEEEFTMATMLQSLNIDPDLIGYDLTAQTWSDKPDE